MLIEQKISEKEVENTMLDESEKNAKNDLDKKLVDDLDRELQELMDDKEKDKNKSDEVSEANTCICQWIQIYC